MDSKDADAEVTGNHQSTIEQVHIEDEKPEALVDQNPERQLVEPVNDKPDGADNKSLSSKRLNSASHEEVVHEKTAESDADVQPPVQADEEKMFPLSNKEDLTSIGHEKKLTGSSATSSSRTTSTSSIEEVKQMTRRQKVTVIILCFVNLLKYMDRFTIAGTLCVFIPYDITFYREYRATTNTVVHIE